MGKIKLLIKYFVYTVRRKGSMGHGIHSPSVFELNRNVLNNKESFPEYRKLIDYRSSLLTCSRKIDVSEIGAGSVVFSSAERRVSDIARYTSSSLGTGKLLFRLSVYLKPEKIIELGGSLGFGSFCLACGSPGAQVYSIEGCPEQIDIARRKFARTGTTNVELIEGFFRDKLPLLIENVRRADIVYFDGDHRKKEVIWQFGQCLKMVHPGTLFIIGDIHWSDEMDEAWDVLKSHTAVTLSVDLFYCGLLFFREGIAKQDFILTFSG